MTSSKCLCRRAGSFGSGSRSPAGFAARAAASAFAFAARSAFAFGALSAAGPLSAFGAFLSSLSAIDLNSRAFGHPDLLVAHHLETDAGRLAILRIGERQIGKMHRRLLGDDATLLRRRLLLMALDHVDAANERAVLGRTHLDHLTGAALVAPGNHHDLVALADPRR